MVKSIEELKTNIEKWNKYLEEKPNWFPSLGMFHKFIDATDDFFYSLRKFVYHNERINLPLWTNGIEKELYNIITQARKHLTQEYIDRMVNVEKKYMKERIVENYFNTFLKKTLEDEISEDKEKVSITFNISPLKDCVLPEVEENDKK